MPWNPDVYNQFRDERRAPFLDALALVEPRPDLEVIDLGCGTGELTRELAAQLPGSRVLGIDSSPEMLRNAAGFSNAGLRFERRDISGQLDRPQCFDLIFSNAALQWLPEHRRLFPELLTKLRPGGQLVVQMPCQHRNAANQILYGLAAEEPFREALGGFQQQVSMLEAEDYAELLFRAGGRDIQVFEKIYPVIVPDARGVYDFISGSALRPYLAALAEDRRAAFEGAYLERMQERFPGTPVFYPFKRILLSARV